jgi:N-terminal acetyltransferase B complex non-catalytic subunit
MMTDQLALRMHKTFKVNKYLFWAVNCLLLQSRAAPEVESRLLLTLAERMMIKAVEDTKISQFEGNRSCVGYSLH